MEQFITALLQIVIFLLLICMYIVLIASSFLTEKVFHLEGDRIWPEHSHSSLHSRELKWYRCLSPLQGRPWHLSDIMV